MKLIKNLIFYSLLFCGNLLLAEACSEIGCGGAGPSGGTSKDYLPRPQPQAGIAMTEKEYDQLYHFLLEDGLDLYFNKPFSKSSRNDFFYEELCFKKILNNSRNILQKKSVNQQTVHETMHIIHETIRNCILDIITSKAENLLGDDPSKKQIIQKIQNHVTLKLQTLEKQVPILRQNPITEYSASAERVCVMNLFIEPTLGRTSLEALNKKVAGLVAEEKYTLR